MNIIVCIKQVPDTSEISIDPETGTLNRAGVESVINPLDVNALEAAITLREEYGGTVTVLSMGPGQAEEAVREALAMGADTGLLCTDKKFAGADTWATACTLEAAIRSIEPPDIIICGKQAIDGDTAQVPAELAVRLGMPFLPYVSKIAELKNGTIRAKSMTDSGSSLLSASLPVLCTVVKSINVPRLVSLGGWIRSFDTTVRLLTAEQIDVENADIGLKGSPTRVKKITPVVHSKEIRYLDADKEEDLELICKILRQASSAGPDLPEEREESIAGSGTPAGDKSEKISALYEPFLLDDHSLPDELFPGIYVLGEVDPENTQLRRVSYELLKEAERLAEIRDCELYLVLPGGGTEVRISGRDRERINSFGVQAVFTVPVGKGYGGGKNGGFEANRFAEAVGAVLSRFSPEIVLAPASMAGRAYVPLLASRLKTGLTADCTRFDIDTESGALLQTRPAFGGNIMATIITRNHQPQMATVRPHVLPASEGSKSSRRSGAVFYEIRQPYPQSTVSILESEKTLGNTEDISNAPIIISGGRGVGGESGDENRGFPLLKRLARQVGASVGASRSSVEAGWAPYHQQVGQTGKTVQPKVYIACAISGAVQHIVGMHDSETVIAVNKDPEAPIFESADYGFIDDYSRVIGKLLAHCGAEGAVRQ